MTFRDEPGEGTGVARSFYSAVAEALLSMSHLPTDLLSVNEEGSGSNDDGVFGGSTGGTDGLGNASSNRRHPASNSPTRTFFSRLSKRNNGRGIQDAIGSSSATANSFTTETPGTVGGGSVNTAFLTNSDSALNDSYATRMRTRSQRGQSSTLSSSTPTTSTVPAPVPIGAPRRGHKNSKNEDTKLKTGDEKFVLPSDKLNFDPTKNEEYKPLFYKISKHGFFTPIPGNNSPLRLNAFRNVGR